MVKWYSRVSEAAMVDGETITAQHLNDEFNSIVDGISAAFDNTSGHTHDGTSGNGPLIGISGVKFIIVSATSPDVDNDSSEGLHAGTLWINTSANNLFFSTDATDGAAVWKRLVTTGEDLSADRISASSMHVSQITVKASATFAGPAEFSGTVNLRDGTRVRQKDHGDVAAGTIDIEMSSPSIHTITMTGNLTFNYVSPISGESFYKTLRIGQDSTGGRSATFTFNSASASVGSHVFMQDALVHSNLSASAIAVVRTETDANRTLLWNEAVSGVT